MFEVYVLHPCYCTDVMTTGVTAKNDQNGEIVLNFLILHIFLIHVYVHI